MPTEFSLDLGDGIVPEDRLADLDRHLAEPDVPRIVPVQASLERWSALVQLLCDLRSRGVMPLVQVSGGNSLSDAAVLERFRFLSAWDQCLLANVLVVVERFLPDAYRTALQQESRIEAKFFREWATAATERLGRYPALPWRRFIRNVNEENYRFAEACVLAQNEPPALGEAVKRLLEAKRKTVNIFPKKFNARNREAPAAPASNVPEEILP